MAPQGTVVGVVGARGGVGATTLAAALAQVLVVMDPDAQSGRSGLTAGRRTPGAPLPRSATVRGGPGAAPGRDAVPLPGDHPVVLVDLDAAGGGIDVHLGIEDVAGLRWPDLAGARGEVSGDELSSVLPTWCGVPVLSADRWRPGPAPPDVVGDVLDGLRACHRTVLLDLGRAEVLDRGPGPRRCAAALVVTSRDLRSVAGVVALRDALRATVPDVRLVLRGPGPGGLGALEVAHVVDLPVAATLPRDRHLAAVVERGLGPVVRRRGRHARAVRRLAVDVS